MSCETTSSCVTHTEKESLRTDGGRWGEYLKEYGQKFPKVDENHTHTDPRSSMTHKHRDRRKAIPRHSITKLLKTRDKEKSSKASRRKTKNHRTNVEMERMTSHFSWEQWKWEDRRGTHLMYRRKPSKAPLKL